ncbi:hypothetical protein ACDF64_06840 [Agromyces sp. MMS24-JH15]|uniref:hypothetical protein n=1 Tax=Agromyces sp. MMS24-JH15 TaxID=3243765 RepID=UPI00374A6530
MEGGLATDRHGLIRFEAVASAGRLGELRSGTAAGRIRRIRHGVYELEDAPTAAPSTREREALRYRRLVLAAAGSLRAPVFTAWSAIALFRLPVIGGWPGDVYVMSAGAHGKRRPGVVSVARRSPDVPTTVVEGVGATSVEFSLIQLCRVAPLADALAAVDAALRVDPFGRTRPLTTVGALRAEHERLLPYHGSRRAEAVLSRAVDSSDSVLETASRLVIEELGFAEPVLQHPIRLPEPGRTARLDFYWPEVDAGAEADGRGKYLSGGGEDVARRVLDEKDRENAIRRRIRAFDRWDWTDVRRRTPLADRLRAMGVPVTRRPRPGLLL